ncbi:hypothetical protein BO221_25455 [Archangium sp. Cb G35]|uniref:hypothetical protein n=1 Tax=Archangium sp. Cb G35 TaxID=1920190 RepID=UPI000935DB66|nr:hypothetical protein [Archangium sp. Cb G35]OJT22085.1 hypothetical protein BO221_25455 [Archangium sp. Cb G35]
MRVFLDVEHESGMDRPRPEDVILIVPHNWGTLEMTIPEWIARGPGLRPGIQPVAARHARTGKPLPLRVLPLRYRNTWFSRWLIRVGVFSDPWPKL